MIFKIERTSNRKSQPCKESYRKAVPIYRSDKDGIGVVKVGMEDAWVINIKSLKQLLDFIGEYGDIVLTDDSIEIYDSYRE